MAGKIDAGLESMAYVLSDCDPEKTRTRYLSLRAEQLKRAHEEELLRKEAQQQAARIGEWCQNRYKVTRRRSSHSTHHSSHSSHAIKSPSARSYPSLSALLHWVTR